MNNASSAKHQGDIPAYADTSAVQPVPTEELGGDPVETIVMTMGNLSEAGDLIKLAMTEVLCVARFCGEVKGTSLSLSLLAEDGQASQASIELLVEKLYQDAQQSLLALSRTSRRAQNLLGTLEQAAKRLQALAIRIDGQRSECSR